MAKPPLNEIYQAYIDRTRWKKIEAIVDEALELQQPERARFIRQACGEDSKFMSQVNKMIYYILKAEEENFLDP